MSLFDITLSNASTLTQNFQNNNSFTQKGGAFPQAEITAILNQSGCLGIRYYFAQDSNGNIGIILTGIDSGGDMTGGSLKYVNSNTCPPVCSAANTLNHL